MRVPDWIVFIFAAGSSWSNCDRFIVFCQRKLSDRLVAGFQGFALFSLLGFQDNPGNVMRFQHGMFH